MKNIKLGEKLPNKEYGFRETCFGICEKNGKILLVKKNGEYSLVGGGIEESETKHATLKREFIEEAGRYVKNAKGLCKIDCYWMAAQGTYPMRSLCNIYMVELTDKQIPPTEEGHTPEWVSKTKALKLLVLPYQIEGLKYYLNTTKNLATTI